MLQVVDVTLQCITFIVSSHKPQSSMVESMFIYRHFTDLRRLLLQHELQYKRNHKAHFKLVLGDDHLMQKIREISALLVFYMK